MTNYLRRRRLRRQTAADVAQIDPDDAAQMLRTWMRRGIGDRRTRLLLARRGQLSTLPGNRPAMKKYEAAIRGGRQIRYGVFLAEFWTQMVPAEMEAEIEEALRQGVDEDGS